MRLRDFRGLPRDSLMGRTSSREKHLNKFFKIFVLSVLAIDPWQLSRDLTLSRKSHVLGKLVNFLNVFSFPSNISVTVHCLPYLKHSQTHRVTLKQTSIFTLSHLKIFEKKVWVFSFSLHSSCSESCLLESVSCWFDLGYLFFRWWVGRMFVVFGFLGFVD